MLFPHEYPEFEAAPASPIVARIAAGAASIALAIASLSAITDTEASDTHGSAPSHQADAPR